MRFVDGIRVMLGRSSVVQPVAPLATSGSLRRGRGSVRGGNNPDAPDQSHKWRRLGAESVRNLSDFDHRTMVQQCSRSSQADGLCRSHIRLITSATVGAQEVGPIVKCENAADRKLLQAFVDQFWADPVNDLGPALPEFMDGLTTTGSLALTVHTGEDAEGRGSLATAIGYIDPECFVSPGVLTDPGNVRAPWAVLRSGFVRDELIAHPILRSDDTVHEFFAGKRGQVVQLDRSTRYGGQLKMRVAEPCFYLGINRTAPNQSVGISDLYTVLDLAGLLDELVFGAVQRSINIGAYSLHVTFPRGTDQAVIDQRMQDIQADLESGEGRAIGTTDDVGIKAVSAALQAGEWATLERTARTNALMGLGPWPLHMFSDGSSTNVATAAEQGSPVANVLLSRQNMFKKLMLRIVLFALRRYPEAVAAIERNEDFDLELPLPTIVAKDTTRESNTLLTETNTLLTAESGGLINLEAAQREFREHANRYGFAIKPEDAPDVEELEAKRSFSGLPFPEMEPEADKVSEGTPAAVEDEVMEGVPA